MVQINELRANFSRRLRQAISNAGWEDRGTGKRLAKLAGVGEKAASKWLNAQAIPRQDRLLAITRELRVSPCWLEYGEEGESSSGEVRETAGVYQVDDKLIALISIIQAAREDGELTDGDLRTVGDVVKSITNARSTK